MKRSEINSLIRHTKESFSNYRGLLSRWGYSTPADNTDNRLLTTDYGRLD